MQNLARLTPFAGQPVLTVLSPAATDHFPTTTVPANGKGHLQDVVAIVDRFQDPANSLLPLSLNPGSAEPPNKVLLHYLRRPLTVYLDHVQERDFPVMLVRLMPLAAHERLPATSVRNPPTRSFSLPRKPGLASLEPCQDQEPRLWLPQIAWRGSGLPRRAPDPQ